MSVLTVITRDVTDEAGNLLDGAQVTIREGHESGGALATLYADEAGAVAITNPVTLDGLSDGSPAPGQLQVYAESGLYRLEGTGAAGVGFSLIDTTSFGWFSLYESRNDMAGLIAGGFVPTDGLTYHLDGLQYVGTTGATVIPDLPGLVLADGASVSGYGGNNAGSIAAAHASGTPVDYGSTLWSEDEAASYYNLYGATKYRTASEQRLQYGLAATPVSDARPVQAVVKFSSATRDIDPTAFDQTGYYGLISRSGDAPAVALSGHVRSDFGADRSKGRIGVHGRAESWNSDDLIYAGWFYAASNTGVDFAAHALELNGYTVADPGYGGNHQLIRCCLADNTSDVNRYSTAISIGPNNTGGTNTGFHTGIHFERASIVRGAVLDGEAIRIDAPIIGTGNIGGVRFAKGEVTDLGVFKYALRTDEASFAGSEAVILGNAQRLSWFGGGARNASLVGGATTLTLSNVPLNVANPVSNNVLQAASVPVVGTRKTGWAAPTGTSSKATFDSDTATTAQVAARLHALIDDLTIHGLIGA